MDKTEIKEDSLEDLTWDVRGSFSRLYDPSYAPPMQPAPVPYVEETYPDYVIVCLADKHYKVSYSTQDTGVVFAPQNEWEEVEETWAAKKDDAKVHDNPEVKVGRRNSSKDQTALQNAHDALVNVGAVCGPSGKSIELDEALVSFGEKVTAVKMADGTVKLGGYLVRFSTEEDPDVTGDFFTKNTDFGDAEISDSWFNHRLPVKFDGSSVDYREKLSTKAKLKKDEVGVWAEIVIGAANAYEQKIGELGLAGKLGWSSGTAAHLVDRKPAKNDTSEITRWILGLDASLTPTPAEPRNTVVPIKSLFTPETVATAGEIKSIQSQESEMDEKDVKALLDGLAEKFSASITEATKTAADEAVKKYAETLPEVKAGNVIVTGDEADRSKANPFKSGGEFLMAVRNATIDPANQDKRLYALKENMKATGLNEAIPSQGGFLVPNEVAAGIKQIMHKTGSLLTLFKADPVTGNNMTYNIVDETSRADGSRFGGVQGYWMAEGGTKTASKPKFRQLELKLKKVAALCYATDELLEDTTALESWLTTNVPNELRFKVEDAFINGDGVGKPLGILNSGALKTVTRQNASGINATDIGNMWAARWAGYDDYVWVGNQGIFPQMLNLSIGQQPVFLTPGGLSNLPYASLLGRPYFDVEYLPALGTAGDLMLISPSAYQVIEKSGGIQTASSIHVQFVTDETAFRFVYRVDAAPTWTTTLTGKDTGTYSPFVVLSATS